MLTSFVNSACMCICTCSCGGGGGYQVHTICNRKIDFNWEVDDGRLCIIEEESLDIYIMRVCVCICVCVCNARVQWVGEGETRERDQSG
jgi:hypothetical protein